jgi:hypothetical protein
MMQESVPADAVTSGATACAVFLVTGSSRWEDQAQVESDLTEMLRLHGRPPGPVHLVTTGDLHRGVGGCVKRIAAAQHWRLTSYPVGWTTQALMLHRPWVAFIYRHPTTIAEDTGMAQQIQAWASLPSSSLRYVHQCSASQ